MLSRCCHGSGGEGGRLGWSFRAGSCAGVAILGGMPEDAAIDEFIAFAKDYTSPDLRIRDATVLLDERQDGEPVTRVRLLVSDPVADTWDVDRVRDLRLTLGRKATELGLPPVSLTLIAESEIEAAEIFAR